MSLGDQTMFFFIVALCAGVAAAEIHQQVLSLVAKPMRMFLPPPIL
jgi:hypothetical protein